MFKWFFYPICILFSYVLYVQQYILQLNYHSHMCIYTLFINIFPNWWMQYLRLIISYRWQRNDEVVFVNIQHLSPYSPWHVWLVIMSDHNLIVVRSGLLCTNADSRWQFCSVRTSRILGGLSINIVSVDGVFCPA